MTQRVRSYLPLFNRMVAFKVADDSNHGQPNPRVPARACIGRR